jgi:hypothetical protein
MDAFAEHDRRDRRAGSVGVQMLSAPGRPVGVGG